MGSVAELMSDAAGQRPLYFAGAAMLRMADGDSQRVGAIG